MLWEASQKNGKIGGGGVKKTDENQFQIGIWITHIFLFR